MHKKQEEILRTRIHNLEKVIFREERLLKSLGILISLLGQYSGDGELCSMCFILKNEIDKELKNDFC